MLKIIILFLFLLVLLFFLYSFTKYNKFTITICKRPFVQVFAVDENNHKTPINIALITFPFIHDGEDLKLYKELKQNGYYFLGCTSYSEFPGDITNIYDPAKDKSHFVWKYDYHNLVQGII